TSISEMQKFHFGSKVICSDGDYGFLTHVLFDPTTRHIIQVGFKQGRLFGKSAQLPFDTILSASSDGVRLGLTIEEVNAASKNESANGNALLSSKCVVERAGTANKGVLALLAVHPSTGELAYLVSHHLVP